MDEFYASRKGGRSSGVLHVDRNCPYIRELDDADVISGTRSSFVEDQRLCSVCYSGRTSG